jgi:hypothetical protein
MRLQEKLGKKAMRAARDSPAITKRNASTVKDEEPVARAQRHGKKRPRDDGQIAETPSDEVDPRQTREAAMQRLQEKINMLQGEWEGGRARGSTVCAGIASSENRPLFDSK